jgi:hypothetical protein
LIQTLFKTKGKECGVHLRIFSQIEEALKQIEEKKYYVPYLEKGCNIFKIGVVFGEKERNVVEWLAASGGASP